jgi:hypothetical protein
VGSQDLYAKQILPITAATATATARRRFRMVFSGDVGPNSENIAVGDTLGCRNAAFAFTVHFDGNSDCLFQTITVKGGPGFGFFHGSPPLAAGGMFPPERNIGRNTFDGLVLTYPDLPEGATVGPVLSASADGFHLAQLPFGPTIVNCLFEGHNDDGIAIHGAYSLVVDSSSSSSSSNGVSTTHAALVTAKGGAIMTAYHKTLMTSLQLRLRRLYPHLQSPRLATGSATL